MPLRKEREALVIDDHEGRQHLIRPSRLDDPITVEELRWLIVCHALEALSRLKRAWHALRQAGHAHHFDGEGWMLHSVPMTDRSHWASYWTTVIESVPEPVEPTGQELVRAYLRERGRYRRALRWRGCADAALVAALEASLKRDKRTRWTRVGILHLQFAGRDYILQQEPGPQHQLKLTPLCFPTELEATPYLQLDMAINSSRRGVIRTGRAYTPEEVFALAEQPVHRRHRRLDGDIVSTGGKRMRTFKEKGIRCVTCGLVGTRFYKEKSAREVGRWSMSLYGVGKHGNEVLMTRDHIIPRAAGGPDTLENSQPMCVKCNSRKSDIVTVEDDDIMAVHDA